jgi:hypothetical protein
VILKFWESSGINSISLQPLGQGKKVRVANRIRLAHHPRSFDHLAFDQVETLADRVRHLSPHFFNRGRIVSPPVTPRAVCVRNMNGGAQVAIEGLNASESEGVGRWREPCAWETLRNECEDGGRLGQNTVVGDQRRHSTLWIDCKVFRLALIVRAELEAHGVILRTCFLQCDVRG